MQLRSSTYDSICIFDDPFTDETIVSFWDDNSLIAVITEHRPGRILGPRRGGQDPEADTLRLLNANRPRQLRDYILRHRLSPGLTNGHVLYDAWRRLTDRGRSFAIDLHSTADAEVLGHPGIRGAGWRITLTSYPSYATTTLNCGRW